MISSMAGRTNFMPPAAADVPHEQRNARLHLFIEHHVERAQPGLIEVQLLDVDDVIARAEMHVARQRDFDRNLDRRHDGATVGIHEVQFQLALAFVHTGERDAQRHGALRMPGRQFARIDRIERAEQIQLAVVIGGRVTENRYLRMFMPAT